jgi:hypothetical protein
MVILSDHRQVGYQLRRDCFLTKSRTTGDPPEACQLCGSTGAEICFSVQLDLWCCFSCYEVFTDEVGAECAGRERRNPPRRGLPYQRPRKLGSTRHPAHPLVLSLAVPCSSRHPSGGRAQLAGGPA